MQSIISVYVKINLHNAFGIIRKDLAARRPFLKENFYLAVLHMVTDMTAIPIPKKLTRWNVTDLCFMPQESSFAVIILNTSLSKNNFDGHVIKLWQKASVRICVDGGTNEFFSYIDNSHKQHNSRGNKQCCNGQVEENDKLDNGQNVCPQNIPLPNIISGDFDSIEPDILQHYSKLGVEIFPTPAQDETDFTKALAVLDDYLIKNEIIIDKVLVAASVNGIRFDHVMGNLNTLHKAAKLYPYPVIIMTDHTIMWLLSRGSHRIYVPKSIMKNDEFSWCGYMSFCEPVVVSTSGLKYDVEQTEVIFGQQISTSNTYAPKSNGEVLIECSGQLLWTMGWKSDLTD